MTRSKAIASLAKTIDVVVTPDLIAGAIPRDSSHCMIADAVKAAFPEAKNISVDLATIRFTDPSINRRYIYLTPPQAQRALLEFDQGSSVTPFKFRLKSAAQIVKSGALGPGDRTKKPVHANDRGAVPTVVDGHALPRGPLSRPRIKGRIRAFGLRQLIP